MMLDLHLAFLFLQDADQQMRLLDQLAIDHRGGRRERAAATAGEHDLG